MCRLYGFRSNTPRKVECELVAAQNALIAQSRRDERGESNPDGWGLGTYDDDGRLTCERQTEPAYASAEFRWAAAHVHARTVMAHVRQATVGHVRIENTHPFVYGDWMLSHNGHLDAFDAIRPAMLEAMTDVHRDAIAGSTDSEHIFHLLLSLHTRQPDRPLIEILRQGLQHIIDWSLDADHTAEVALNLLWTDGTVYAGSRLGRSLWMVQRDGVHRCEVCDEVHVEDHPGGTYRAVVVASERITETETWDAVPDGGLFCIDPNVGVQTAML